MEANVRPFPLFDTRSYHPELPSFLGGQRGNLSDIRMRLPVDGDGPPGDEVEGYVPEIVAFDDEVAEHYRPLRERPNVIPLPDAVYVTPVVG